MSKYLLCFSFEYVLFIVSQEKLELTLYDIVSFMEEELNKSVELNFKNQYYLNVCKKTPRIPQSII